MYWQFGIRVKQHQTQSSRQDRIDYMQVSAWEARRCYSRVFYLSYDFKIGEIDFLESGSIYAIILCL